MGLTDEEKEALAAYGFRLHGGTIWAARRPDGTLKATLVYLRAARVWSLAGLGPFYEGPDPIALVAAATMRGDL
jgi:hypothetical protein